MKHIAIIRRLPAIVLAIALCALSSAAFAVEMSAQAGSASVAAGDTVDVTVTVTGENMSIAQGVFTYDPAILTFTEGEGGVSDGFINMISAEKDGADSLSARITFTAAGAGEAKVDFTLEEVLDYDGDSQETASASVTVTVTAPPAQPEPASEPISYAREGIAAQNVAGAQVQMYVWKSLENVTIPSRYSVTTLEYQGQTVEAAIVEDSDAPTLLYLSDDTGETGGYYIYDQAANTLFQYRTLSSVSKSYIIMQPDGSVPVPEGFTETTLTVDERPLAAWVSGDAQGDVYLVYARNPDGEVGFYTYNLEDESLQRYSVLPARPAQPTLPESAATPAPTVPEDAEASPDGEKEGITLSKPLFFAICALAALLLIVVILLLVAQAQERARRRRRAEKRRAQREREKQEEA